MKAAQHCVNSRGDSQPGRFRSLSVCLDDLPPPGLPGEPALITVSRMVQCIALHTIDMTSGDSVTRRRVKIMTGEDNDGCVDVSGSRLDRSARDLPITLEFAQTLSGQSLDREWQTKCLKFKFNAERGRISWQAKSTWAA